MISLHKSAMPAVLVQNGVEWTRVIVEKMARGEELTQAEKTRYRYPQIKQAPVEETHGKCAYCESKLQHIHHGDVEHIFPKSLRPEQTVDWENLTLACEICNQNKSNRDPHVEQIIDPYAVDPAQHLMFAGTIVYPLGTPGGTQHPAASGTKQNGFGRDAEEHLDRLMGLYDTIMRQDIPLAARRAIYDDLKANYAGAAGPYVAMARALVNLMKPQLGPDLEPVNA